MSRRHSARAGNTLAITMMVAALVVVVMMGLLGPTIANLSVATRLDNHQVAANLAESAVAVALNQLYANPSFGQNDETVNADNVPPAAAGLVTFSGAPTFNGGSIPVSTDNLTNSASVLGATGRTVPDLSMDLVGFGGCGASTAIVEVILQLPQFPYALSAGGPITSSGSLLVGSVNVESQLSGGITASSLLSASLASNSSSGINLSAPSSAPGVVTGNVVSSGSVSTSNVTVSGKVEQNQAAQGQPSIGFFDVRKNETTFQAESSPLSSSNTLVSFCYCSGPLTVTGGDLNLNNAVLSVSGDLTVSSGGITGNGVVYVSGHTTLAGSGALQTSQGVALISTGDVTIQGAAANSSFFTGLVYTQGNLSINNASVVGAVVQNGTAPVTLNNVQLVLLPNLSTDFGIATDATNQSANDFNNVYTSVAAFSRPMSSARVVLWEFL